MKVRFKDENGNYYETPQELTIDDLFVKIKETNKDGKNTNVITNSAEYGLIPQSEFFDKSIAVEGNTNKYTIIKEGDFVYNPRKSSNAPYGPFKCYTLKEPGIVSPLYSCLRLKNKKYTKYLLYYFSSTAWHSYIYHNGNQGGARHDRVGMTDDLLKNIPVVLPCIEEQDKISNFLSIYDEALEIQQKKCITLEKRKSSLLQKIFSQKIKFKNKNGEKFDGWQDYILGDILKEYKEKCEDNGTFEHVSLTKEGVVPKTEKYNREHLVTHDDKNYRITHYNDICYNPANLKFGVICRNKYKDAIFSPIYVTFKVNNGFLPEFMEYLLIRPDFINYALQFQEGSIYERMAVSPENLLSITVSAPSLEEQKKIAEFMTIIDKQIEIEKNKLEAMKKLKNGLLQKLFD